MTMRLVGVAEVVSMAVSLAALIFSGDLAGGVSRATIGFIVGSGIVLLIVGARTSMTVAISGAQDAGAVVMAAIGATIASEAAPDQRLATMFVAIALAGFLTSVLFLAVGRARLAEAARSIPFTVISGFMAGTGWLLARGGFEVMTDLTPSLDNIGSFFSWDVGQLWLPGLVLALVLAIGLDRRHCRYSVWQPSRSSE